MPKLSTKTVISLSTRLKVIAVLAVLVVAGSGTSIVRADSYSTKIKALQAQNGHTQDRLDDLGAQASNYQDAISQLSAQIASVQRGIAANQARQAKLQKEILQKQAEIARERVVLGDVLRSMYVDGQMTTIEMLATSDSLSDYVDKEEYRNSVQGKIQSALADIAALQKQLEGQKMQVEQLIIDQKNEQAQLAANKRKKAAMLSYNQHQQANFNQQLKANRAKIIKLQAEQAAAQAAYGRQHHITYYGTAGNGGYPSIWANATQDTLVDDWGMLNRECVSYVAWKVAATGHYMPHWGGDYANHAGGNAYAWIENANIDHIHRTGSPPSSWRSGVAVVWDQYDGVGPVGHVAYLEAVNSDGSIEVSQYNFGYGLHGKFSRMHVDAGEASRLDYIYF